MKVFIPHLITLSDVGRFKIFHNAVSIIRRPPTRNRTTFIFTLQYNISTGYELNSISFQHLHRLILLLHPCCPVRNFWHFPISISYGIHLWVENNTQEEFKQTAGYWSWAIFVWRRLQQLDTALNCVYNRRRTIPDKGTKTQWQNKFESNWQAMWLLVIFITAT